MLDAFPLAKLWPVPDPDADDFLLDMYAPVEEHLFFRWAITTHGPARLLVYSCYRFSLLLLEPPEWMKQEILLSQRLLTDGR